MPCLPTQWLILIVGESIVMTSSTPKLLIAEDNPISRRVLQDMLISLGHYPDMVENGRQAVQATDKVDYGLILMDIQMPEMNGIEATKIIRERAGPQGEVPIVAVTAFSTSDYADLCAEAGMNDFLIKPITRKDLHRVLQEQFVDHQSDEKVDDTVFDGHILEQMSEVISTDSLSTLIRNYMADIDRLLEQIASTDINNDLERIQSAAHELKGIAGQVGASLLSALAAELESHCRSQHVNRFEKVALLTDLRDRMIDCRDNTIEAIKTGFLRDHPLPKAASNL